MKQAKSNSGFVIGAIFTAASVLSCGTFIVPMLAIMPGMLFEKMAAHYVNNVPYSNVGKLTILLLAIVFVVALSACMFRLRNNARDTGYILQRQIIFIMVVMYLIVHPLAFYIYWGLALDFRSDGQLLFSAIMTVPFSSVAFVLIGLLTDKIKNKAISSFTAQDIAV